MKKFLVIVIALAAAGGSAFAVFQKGMVVTDPMAASMFSSASSHSQDFMESFMAEDSASSRSEDTLLMDAGLASSQSETSMSASAASRRVSTLTSGAYADYTVGVIGNGEASVLFFYDKTDADSKATDAAIKAVYKTGDAEVTTYRVDINTFASVKTTYGITAGNTVVLLDGQGTVVKTVSNPSANELKALLSNEAMTQ